MMNTISAKNKKIVSGNRIILFFLMMILLLGVHTVWALPAGEQVVSGKASFTRSGNNLTIVNTPNAIVNWQNFSIQSNESVRFIQPGSQSAVLNRIVGQNPSIILGMLQSNGKVFLINPNGIVFGTGARIDVQGLIASTLDISNTDFLAGRYFFTAGIHAADIQNQGSIKTPAGGRVYLIAPNVTNSGIITTPQGEVLLAAGSSVKLVDSSNPAIAVVVSAPQNSAVNLGRIISESGTVGIYGGLVRQSGVVNADSAARDDQGRIVLRASQSVELSSDSVTSAKNISGKGGSVQILGETVKLEGNARVDASGYSGGGEILIGGGYQGSDASVPNAQNTYVGRDVQIAADALQKGDGGKVVVWSDKETAFSGKISARGGEQSGNGGNVEVSGKKTLTYNGLVDLSAPRGQAGNLLLDPLNFTIGTDITGAALAAQLGLSNVIVQTADTGSEAGNIYVNDSVSWSNSNTLTMKAHNDIIVNNVIRNSGGGNLVLRADSDASGAGTVSFAGSGAVVFTGGGTASIYYNPAGGYAAPVNYSGYFTGVTPTAYMLINNVTDLQNVNNNLTGNYALGANIDASATTGWNGGKGFEPLGNDSLDDPTKVFSGIFDGNGYTISNLFISRSGEQYVGMFAATYQVSTIRNVWLENVDITGGYQTGGLAAHICGGSGTYGTISNSYVTGSVSGHGMIVGGLVGLNAGIISNSYSKASVNGNGNSWVGGLVGCLWGPDARIVNSYSTGLVSNGSSRVGGLVGGKYSTAAGAVTGSYWNTETSGQASSDGGTGVTIALMRAKGTFTGWDFTNIWGIEEGSSYPYFTGNHLLPSGTTVVITNGSVTPVPSTPNPNIARQIAADNTAIAHTNVIKSFYLSWNENVPHYESWDDYFKTHVRAISWTENVKRYATMEDYIKDHPPTAIAMNRSLQVDPMGNFIDGLLNSLDYLTNTTGGGLGFASLEKGGRYGGYDQNYTGEYSGYTGARNEIKSSITRTKEDQELADKINAGKKTPLNFVHDKASSGSGDGESSDSTALVFDHYDKDGIAIYRNGTGYVNSRGQITDKDGIVLIQEAADDSVLGVHKNKALLDVEGTDKDSTTDSKQGKDDTGRGLRADDIQRLKDNPGLVEDRVTKFRNGEYVAKHELEYLMSIGAITSTNPAIDRMNLRQANEIQKLKDDPLMLKVAVEAYNSGKSQPEYIKKYLESSGAVTAKAKVMTSNVLEGDLQRLKNDPKYVESTVEKFRNGESLPRKVVDYLYETGAITNTNPAIDRMNLRQANEIQKLKDDPLMLKVAVEAYNSGKSQPEYIKKYLESSGAVTAKAKVMTSNVLEGDLQRLKNDPKYVESTVEKFRNGESLPRKVVDYLYETGAITNTNPAIDRMNLRQVNEIQKLKDDPLALKVAVESYNSGKSQPRFIKEYLESSGAVTPRPAGKTNSSLKGNSPSPSGSGSAITQEGEGSASSSDNLSEAQMAFVKKVNELSQDNKVSEYSKERVMQYVENSANWTNDQDPTGLQRVIVGLPTSDLIDIMTDDKLSEKGFRGISMRLGTYLPASQISEIAQELPGDKLATMINSAPFLDAKLVTALSSENISSAQLSEAAPYMNIGQVAFLKQNYPAAYAKLAPGLPEGVEGIVDQYGDQAYNIKLVLSGDRSKMVPDVTMKEIADLQRQGKIPPPSPRVDTSK